MAKLLRALAVENRLEIIRLLGDRAICVGGLSRQLGISAGAVSQHLAVLKQVGLVESDRRGNHVHYHLAADAAERCRAVVAELFTAASPVECGDRGGHDDR